jgi:hypothetical protein
MVFRWPAAWQTCVCNPAVAASEPLVSAGLRLRNDLCKSCLLWQNADAARSGVQANSLAINACNRPGWVCADTETGFKLQPLICRWHCCDNSHLLHR